MRIGLNALFLVPGKVGGTEIYVRNLVRALAAASPDDDFVLYLAHEAAGTFRDLPRNVQEVACTLRAESRPVRIAYEQTLLPMLAARDRIDVLHSLGYTGPLVANCPTVVTVHDLNYHFHPEDWSAAGLWANRALIPLVARRATRVLTISNSSRDAIRDVLLVPADKIDVVYHGVDGNLAPAKPAAIAAVRERLQLEGPYLLTVTASHPHKNLERLVAAYDRINRPPPLVVVGIRGRAHATLLDAASRPGRGRIVVTGWIENPELAALYRDAQAFVFASMYEGFGFPPLEAMSVAVPVVTSAAASLAELVTDAALTFNPNDTDDMAHAMDTVLNDAPLRASLIAKGLERAARFRWQDCALHTLAVYERARMSYRSR